MGDDEDRSLGGTIADDNVKMPLEVIANSALAIGTQEALTGLERRDSRILALRFGIGVDRELTPTEVGREFGISHERVRRLVERACRKLRGSELGESLRTLHED